MGVFKQMALDNDDADGSEGECYDESEIRFDYLVSRCQGGIAYLNGLGFEISKRKETVGRGDNEKLVVTFSRHGFKADVAAELYEIGGDIVDCSIVVRGMQIAAGVDPDEFADIVLSTWALDTHRAEIEVLARKAP